MNKTPHVLNNKFYQIIFNSHPVTQLPKITQVLLCHQVPEIKDKDLFVSQYTGLMQQVNKSICQTIELE